MAIFNSYVCLPGRVWLYPMPKMRCFIRETDHQPSPLPYFHLQTHLSRILKRVGTSLIATIGSLLALGSHTHNLEETTWENSAEHQIDFAWYFFFHVPRFSCSHWSTANSPAVGIPKNVRKFASHKNRTSNCDGSSTCTISTGWFKGTMYRCTGILLLSCI